MIEKQLEEIESKIENEDILVSVYEIKNARKYKDKIKYLDMLADYSDEQKEVILAMSIHYLLYNQRLERSVIVGKSIADGMGLSEFSKQQALLKFLDEVDRL